jgi:hypothetical protein
MFALNAATGAVLWQFRSGGTVYGGPAIANGVVYWGCGYPNGLGAGARPLGFGSSCHKLYAFAPGLAPQDAGADTGAPSMEAGAAEGGSPADAGSPTDASPADASPADASPADAAGD